MKILCNYTASGPHYVRSGWKSVFEGCGHQFRFWEAGKEAAFDVFGEYEPDIYLGTTYELDRAISKCIAARPHLKAALFGSAWGPLVNDIDQKKFPLVIVSEQEKKRVEALKEMTGQPLFVFIHAHDRWLEGTMSGWRNVGVEPVGILNACDIYQFLGGRYRPEFHCDATMVGGYWGYKSRNIDKFLIPLCHPNIGLSIKIFGGPGWPVAQHLGYINDADVKDLFCSATVCPNVSEPHSTEKTLSFDVVERPYKTMGAGGGITISDYVEEARDLFDENELIMCKSPDNFMDTVRHFVHYPDEREPYIEAGQKKVLSSHTYHDRVSVMLTALGFPKEAEKAIQLKNRILEVWNETR